MTGKYLAKKPRRKWGWLLAVLFVCFLTVAVFSVVKLVTTQREYDVGTDVYTQLAQSVVIRQPIETITPEQPDNPPVMVLPSEDEETPEPPAEPEDPAQSEQGAKPGQFVVNFELLTEINPQTVAWISAPFGMDYPVVQGTDNEYYLNHLIDGTVNRNGSIFVDHRNTPGFTDRNTFIYGHNMLNGAMFAGLVNYGTAGYAQRYPELTLTTPDGTYTLQVFAGYVTPGNSDIYQLSYESDENFENYLETIRALSDFQSDVPVTAQDRIVTLSTCTYDYEDARYVLHCRLVPMQ